MSGAVSEDREPPEPGPREAPRVSVVVPNFNHARFLPPRMESVLGQSYRDIEVLLLDDASTDGSREVIRRYEDDPRVRTIFNETNSGSPFVQWNRGVREAKGEYVWIAESDDLADPRLLERVVGMLEEHPDCGVGCCESWLLRGEGSPEEGELKPHHRPEPRRDFWTRDFVADGREICVQDLLHGNVMPNASAVVFRRTLFERVGGADESMRMCGDWLLWARMLSRSRLAHVGERLNIYRFHDSTVRARKSATGPTIAEVYAVIRFIRDDAAPPAARLRRALRERAAYFARASAERGVGAWEILDACLRVRDVDPRIWSRLGAAWARHRLRLALRGFRHKPSLAAPPPGGGRRRRTRRSG